LLLPLSLLFALSLPGLFGGDWEADDSLWAAFGLAAWRDGPWWQPSMFDQPYFHKPPLGLLIHALSQWVFGPTVFAARLPSLLAAGVAVVAVGGLVRRWCGRRAALFSGVALATTVEFFRQTSHVSLDLWMAAWFALAAWCVSTAVVRERARFVLLAGVCFGAALLTKQVIALFALPMFAAWLLPRARSPSRSRRRGTGQCTPSTARRSGASTSAASPSSASGARRTAGERLGGSTRRCWGSRTGRGC